MYALFVHGMGRSPLSGCLLLWRLKLAGFKIKTFGYAVTIEDFTAIKTRLILKITKLAAQDDYVLIGHSLGGVLLRAAVNSLPTGTRQPQHLFLIGSPTRPPRLAKKLQRNPIFRVATRDCGQMLASENRMASIGHALVPTTCIAGVCNMPWKNKLFGDEANDGIVSLSEVSEECITDEVHVPVVHTLLPSSKCVAQIILARFCP